MNTLVYLEWRDNGVVLGGGTVEVERYIIRKSNQEGRKGRREEREYDPHFADK